MSGIEARPIRVGAFVLVGAGGLLAFSVGEAHEPPLEEVPPRAVVNPGALADTVPALEELVSWLGSEEGREQGREGVRLRALASGPDAQNRWLQLLSALEWLDPATAPAAVRAVGLAEEGDALGGTELLMAHLEETGPPERAPLIALAALIAERDDPILAAELRARLLEDHASAPEAAEAGLRHAKWLLSIEARRDEGLALLEELIVARPDHPVTPEARRLFLRERAAGPGSVPAGGSP